MRYKALASSTYCPSLHRILLNAVHSATKTWIIFLGFGNGSNISLQAIRSQVKVQSLCLGYPHSDFHWTVDTIVKLPALPFR
jgi:hypothetical protein